MNTKNIFKITRTYKSLDTTGGVRDKISSSPETILGKLESLQNELRAEKEKEKKNALRSQIHSLQRELNRTKQFSEISSKNGIEDATSLDTMTASQLFKIDKESGQRRGEFLSKSYLYKRTTDQDGNTYEESTDGKNLKEGDILYVDFGNNRSAEAHIGAADFIPMEYKVVKIIDQYGKERIGKRSIQGNKVGYYDDQGYIPIYNGYSISIIGKEASEKYIKSSNPDIIVSNDEGLESLAKDAYIETSQRYDVYGEGFTPWNIYEKQKFQREATELAKKIQEKYQIPWEVTYAQATLETGYGKHAPNNNYFGIKGGSIGTYKTKEIIDGKEVTLDASFRGYNSMEESFEDYAKLLTQNTRYKNAFNHKNNPELFLNEIISSGYATDPLYVSKAKKIWNNYDRIKNFVIEAPELHGKTSPEQLIQEARKYLGTTYQWGGNSIVGIDCSHLISKSLIGLGVATENFYRVAKDLREMTPSKPITEVTKGDLIFWHGGERGISHVAIALGSPKNGQITILDASGPSSGLGKVAERTVEIKPTLSAGTPIFYS